MCIGTPLCDFNLEFRVLVSAVMGSERVSAPGIDVMLEVVRMAVNKQFPTLMTTLYPGSLASDLKPNASLDIWSSKGSVGSLIDITMT